MSEEKQSSSLRDEERHSDSAMPQSSAAESNAALVILSGLSGSGKSTALAVFEDAGYFCVDNLPAPLISHFVEFIEQLRKGSDRPLSPTYQKLALLVDCREAHAFRELQQAVGQLRQEGVSVHLLFLECQEEVLIRRFQETRRAHPLLKKASGEGSISEALARERELLSEFRGAADRIIDTSSFNVHDLRRVVAAYVEDDLAAGQRMGVTIASFGFKYGLPTDADIVLDVRFLANPYFVPALRHLSGCDEPVREYVFHDPASTESIRRLAEMLHFLLPRYEHEGKAYLRVAIGCTGGRHRSVACAERLGELLKAGPYAVTVAHRDLKRA